MICQNCERYEACENARCNIRGNLGYFDLCIHCVQPIYKFVSKFAVKVDYEEINTEQDIKTTDK